MTGGSTGAWNELRKGRRKGWTTGLKNTTWGEEKDFPWGSKAELDFMQYAPSGRGGHQNTDLEKRTER